MGVHFCEFLFGEDEAEAFGEAAKVAFDGFVKSPSRHPIYLGKVGIQYDALVAYGVNWNGG